MAQGGHHHSTTHTDRTEPHGEQPTPPTPGLDPTRLPQVAHRKLGERSAIDSTTFTARLAALLANLKALEDESAPGVSTLQGLTKSETIAWQALDNTPARLAAMKSLLPGNEEKEDAADNDNATSGVQTSTIDRKCFNTNFLQIFSLKLEALVSIHHASTGLIRAWHQNHLRHILAEEETEQVWREYMSGALWKELSRIWGFYGPASRQIAMLNALTEVRLHKPA